MEKRIELEKRGKNSSQIKELNLDGCRSSSIVGLTDEFINLESLSMSNVGLTNLKGFPKLPNLKKLELSDNRLSGGLNYLSGSPKLSHLHLGGNKIATIDALEPLKDFKNLEYLELMNCEVTSLDNYREKIFSLIPSLKYIDGIDENDEEADVSEENGAHSNEESEDEDEDEENEDLDEEEEGEVGLAYLQNSIEEDSDSDDYNPDGAADSDIEIEDDADEDENDNPRGQKRKLENDD